MPRERQRDTANYKIEWDEDVEAVIHTWTGFTKGEQFRNGANDLLEVVESKNASKMIVDTSEIQAHDEADKQWLQETWVPNVDEAGIEYSAQVHRESVISQMEMEEFDEDNDQSGFETFVTDDMSEARDWVASQ